MNKTKQSESCKKNFKNKLRIATVFSGIGAFEHALDRMNIDHNIVFACDK